MIFDSQLGTLFSCFFPWSACMSLCCGSMPPIPSPSSSPESSITGTPSLAVDYGHVIGAADRCKDINQKRIFAAIIKATLLLRLQSKSKDDFSLATAQLNAAMEEGSSAVDYGSVTCKQADQGLGSIEMQKIKRVK